MSNKVDFDQFTENYDELLRKGTSFFSADEKYFAEYKVDLLKDGFSYSPLRILEYGCGIGRNIAFLEKAFPGAEIVGTDISEGSLDVARSENPSVRFEKEMNDLDIGHFDLIFVAGVFHHVPISERSAVALVLANRLAEKGELYVFEHNPYNPVTRRIVNTCPYDADAVLVTPNELTATLTQAGLKSTKRGYCLFVPPKMGFLKSFERYLKWLPLGGQYWVAFSHSR